MKYLLTTEESEKLYPGLKDMPKEKPTGDYPPNFGQTGENHPSWIDGRFSLDKVGYMKEWREKNKDKIKEYQKEYRDKPENKAKKNEYMREYLKEYRARKRQEKSID